MYDISSQSSASTDLKSQEIIVKGPIASRLPSRIHHVCHTASKGFICQHIQHSSVKDIMDAKSCHRVVQGSHLQEWRILLRRQHPAKLGPPERQASMAVSRTCLCNYHHKVFQTSETLHCLSQGIDPPFLRPSPTDTPSTASHLAEPEGEPRTCLPSPRLLL